MLKQIYETYYVDEETPDSALTSSHWKFYREQFDVQLDKNGKLTSLKGAGFGELMPGKVQKILNYSCILSYLVRLPYKKDILNLIKISFKICKLAGFSFSYDCFRQVCSLALIRRYSVKYLGDERPVFLIIGDGYGFLSCLTKMVFPNSTLVLVDLGKTLLFQAYYCQKVHAGLRHIYVDGRKSEENLNDYDFVYCPADHLDGVGKLNYDIAINIASLQEMNKPTIEMYFTFLRKHLKENNLFYCCNREYKALRGGEITEFRKYPWNVRDKHFVDGYCPWHIYFFALSKADKGPKILGIRIPLIQYFDGKICHRLTQLSRIG